MSERAIFMIEGQQVNATGYRPSDDFYLSQDLVNGTLFLQVLLWNYLLYLLIYNLLIIICGNFTQKDTNSINIVSLTVHAARVEDQEDGMYYLFTTTFCLCMTTFSVVGIIIGQSLFTIAFILTVPFSCFNTINTLLDSEFQSMKKFFGDEMIDTIANVLLVLVETAASIMTAVYLYQVTTSRYDYIVATIWPIRISFEQF